MASAKKGPHRNRGLRAVLIQYRATKPQGPNQALCCLRPNTRDYDEEFKSGSSLPPAPSAAESRRAFIRMYPYLSAYIHIYPSVPDICGLRAARRRDIEGDRNFYPRNPILLSILSHNNLIYPGFDFWIDFTSPSGRCVQISRWSSTLLHPGP